MSMRAHIRASAVAAVVSAALVVGAPTHATTADAAQGPSITFASSLVDVESFPAGTTRLSGASRYETAVAASQRFAPGVSVAIVATGADFPDALSAGAAAAISGGPLLLTPSDRLLDVVRSELIRLRPDRILVVGGTGVVSAQVQTALSSISPTTRLWGQDRYSTGNAVASHAFTTAEHAIIATGRTFPDALVASGAAGARRGPVVLVDGVAASVPTATMETLAELEVSTISIAGGPGAVSEGIESQLVSAGYEVTRYGGPSRFETAALINDAYFPPGSAATTFLATGFDFPDALAAAPLAGRLAAPLYITSRTCVPPVIADGIDQAGAISRVVMGGPLVVSDAAAANARCVYPVTHEPLGDWAVSRWTLAGSVPTPYYDRPPVDVTSPSVQLDPTGLRIYRRLDTGVRADHPVAYAQYGISALLEHQRTGDEIWLDRALRHGERLAEIHVERDGAWWFPYTFPWTYYERSLSAPWWSAMAQGQALSLFTRLAETTDDDRWELAAERTWASFLQPYKREAPWSTLVIDDHLYFEEYAGDQLPLLVVNGQLFALFGLYDYWRHTGDPEVARYFDGGATTVLDRMLPLARVTNGISYYCVQAEYCQSPRWQNLPYHVIHSWQLDTLGRLTGDSRFSEWADLLRSDWAPLNTSLRSRPDAGALSGMGGDAGWIEP